MARDRESEKIEARDLGADDYLEMPFGIGKLLARIRTALRHREPDEKAPTIIDLGALVIDDADDVQYLRVLVAQLRSKVDIATGQPSLIRNEPGVGYRLQAVGDEVE